MMMMMMRGLQTFAPLKQDIKPLLVPVVFQTFKRHEQLIIKREVRVKICDICGDSS
jgi:hypothetical protein